MSKPTGDDVMDLDDAATLFKGKKHKRQRDKLPNVSGSNAGGSSSDSDITAKRACSPDRYESAKEGETKISTPPRVISSQDSSSTSISSPPPVVEGEEIVITEHRSSPLNGNPTNEEEDGFTIVDRKKKSKVFQIKPRLHPAFRKPSKNNSRKPLPPRDPTLVTIIYKAVQKEQSLHKTQFSAFADSLRALQPQPLACRKVFGGGYALDFPQGTDPTTLLEIKTLGGLEVKSYMPTAKYIGTVKGTYENAQEVEEYYNLHPSNPAITHVQQLGKAKVFKIFFVSEPIPETVTILYQVIPVDKYFESPKRCFKCQVHGHYASSCRNGVYCKKCGRSGHESATCKSSIIACVNCGRAHDAGYKFCEHRLFALRVQKARANLGLSLAEAKNSIAKRYQEVRRLNNEKQRSLASIVNQAQMYRNNQNLTQKTALPSKNILAEIVSLLIKILSLYQLLESLKLEPKQRTLILKISLFLKLQNISKERTQNLEITRQLERPARTNQEPPRPSVNTNTNTNLQLVVYGDLGLLPLKKTGAG